MINLIKSIQETKEEIFAKKITTVIIKVNLRRTNESS